MTRNVVVLGAGVSGLTTALLLSRSGDYKITIVAKHMPGDYDIEYASPWAGADFVPPPPSMNGKSSDPAREPYEIATWPELEKLAAHVPEAGIHFQEAIYYQRSKDINSEKGQWLAGLMTDDNPFRKVLPKFRILPKAELPPNMEAAVSFTSVCINVALYLPWLVGQCLKAGMTVRRGIVSHIAEAKELHHSGKPADLVINCTGLSSLRLGGVEDENLFPSRGQIVLVRNVSDVINGSTGTDDGPNESTYVMNRAAGGGCILGGCSYSHSWEGQPDPNIATRIMKRAIELCPSLVPSGKGIEGLSIVRHAVGLRPMRSGGTRIEKEVLETEDGDGLVVVHNYGHGGSGYQTSYGTAKAAVELVQDALLPGSKL